MGFSLCAHARPRDDHHGKFLGMWNEKNSFSENSDDHRLKFSQYVKATLQSDNIREKRVFGNDNMPLKFHQNHSVNQAFCHRISML